MSGDIPPDSARVRLAAAVWSPCHSDPRCPGEVNQAPPTPSCRFPVDRGGNAAPSHLDVERDQESMQRSAKKVLHQDFARRPSAARLPQIRQPVSKATGSDHGELAGFHDPGPKPTYLV